MGVIGTKFTCSYHLGGGGDVFLKKQTNISWQEPEVELCPVCKNPQLQRFRLEFVTESILCPKPMIQTKIVFTSPSLIQCINE